MNCHPFVVDSFHFSFQRVLVHKSASSIRPYSSGDETDANGAPKTSSSSVLHAQLTTQQSSKSVTCLFTVAEDLDYDDLPEDSQPVLPPKVKPALPPKQLINKSQLELAAIEEDFKNSAANVCHLKNTAEGEDYDELPPEKEAEKPAAGAGDVNNNKNGGGEGAFEDYDEPISHSAAAKGQFEDYDEPIPHTAAK